MEKKPPSRQQRHSFTDSLITMKQQRPPAAVWDCDSSLYDSFELRSFEKQLSSAINSRTLSMPHLPDRRVAPAPAPTPSNTAPHRPPKKISHRNDAVSEAAADNNRRPATTSSKISKSVQRFFRSVFVNVKPTPSNYHQNNNNNNNNGKQKRSSSDRGGAAAYLRSVAAARDQEMNGRFFVYDKTGALCTIPEGPESDFGLSPDIKSLARRTASERFTAATAIGISCA